MKSTHGETEFDVVVADRRQAADEVVALTLQRPSGACLPTWTPGAHIDLVLTDELTRQYSLCGEPGDRARWQIGVLREAGGRGGSAYVHDKLAIGGTVRVRGPRNHFPLEPARRYLFIVGGIGITAILPMVASAAAVGADWTLAYGGRTRASMAFADKVAAYGDRVMLCPQDEFGLLDLGTLIREPTADTLVYCCGPTALLNAVEEHCAGWPPGTLHIERFTPKGQGNLVRSDSFEIELAATGMTLNVSPGRSILDVVENAGVQVLWSCREGTCGTCETTVLAGEVDHRDSLLNDDEKTSNDTMFICVSRAACPKLVLDL